MSDKKQELINTALVLFYNKGIHSVGINEILAASGVAKKTLYHHFKSKDELIIAALKQRNSLYLQWLEESLANAKTNNEFIEYLFNALHKWFNNQVPQLMPFKGCFFINTQAACNEDHAPIAQYCAQHKMEVRQLLKKTMPEADPQLLDMICLLKEGAINAAFLNNEKTAAKKCIELLQHYLHP